MPDPVEMVWRGDAEFAARLEKLRTAADVATGEAVGQATRLVARLFGERFGQPGSAHRRSGKLAGSIQVTGPKRQGFGDWTAQTGPTGAYARVVELGHHKGHGRPGARKGFPTFQPAFNAAGESFPAIFRAAWAGVLEHH